MTWSESSQPLLVKEGEGKDSRFKRFRAVSDLFRTCFGPVSDFKVLGNIESQSLKVRKGRKKESQRRESHETGLKQKMPVGERILSNIYNILPLIFLNMDGFG